MSVIVLHLMPRDAWERLSPGEPITNPSLESEGFIHCTDGASAMIATANRHYREDPRSFVVLTIDLDRVGSRWHVEDPGRIYPHVFGPMARASIVAVTPAPRDPDGEFLPFAG